MLDARQSRSQSWREHCAAAVRAVDVAPDVPLAAQLRDALHRIVQAGRGRAGVDRDRQDALAFGGHAVDRRRHPIGDHHAQWVGRQGDQRVDPEAHDPERSRHRVMARRWGEHHQVGRGAARPGVGRDPSARRQHAGEVGQRSAVGQHAAAVVPTDLGQHPPDHAELQGDARGAHLVDGHAVVDGAVDEVGDRRELVGHRHLMGQEVRVVQAGGPGQEAADERRELVLRHAAAFDPALPVQLGVHFSQRAVANDPAVAAPGRADILTQLVEDRGGEVAELRVGRCHGVRRWNCRDLRRATGARKRVGRRSPPRRRLSRAAPRRTR